MRTGKLEGRPMADGRGGDGNADTNNKESSNAIW